MKALVVTVAAIVSIALGFEIRHLLDEARMERALRGYQQALKPGFSRKTVEEYLHSKGTWFNQQSVNENEDLFSTSVYEGGFEVSDLVPVGQEGGGLVCGPANVFVAFEFAWRHGFPRAPDDSDALVQIKLFRRPPTCL